MVFSFNPAPEWSGGIGDDMGQARDRRSVTAR